MRIFLFDLVAGVVLGIMLMLTVIGILAFRNRREIGPFLLLLSGVLGAVSSIIWLLISADQVQFSRYLPPVILVLSSILLIIGILKWRR
ncbi:MAG: hypothetical protein R6V01_06190 [Thermoplasmatota archaeon]